MSRFSEDALRNELAALIASFDVPFVVAGVAAPGVKLFRLYVDEVGTPRVSCRFVLRWSELASSGESTLDVLDRAVSGLQAEDMQEAVLVITSAAGREQEKAVRAVCGRSPTARVLDAPEVKIEGLLRELVAATPLRQAYDLIVARERAVDGGLELVGRRLFALGAEPGEHTHETVTCTAPEGIFLAVSAWADPVRPSGLVSLDHAPLSPGRHLVKAVLERPGLVTFPGVPGLRHDTRPWSDVVAAMPGRLPPTAPPVHLICAVEVTGSPEELEARRSRAVELVEEVAKRRPSTQRLEVSVIGYGTHVFGTRHADTSSPRTFLWSAPAADALHALESLQPVPPTYLGGAQVEDMLAEVSMRLTPRNDRVRTALLTVGARPPHPPRADASRVLPCPGRYGWDELLQALEHDHGVRLGAICDMEIGDAPPAWHRLGSDVLRRVSAVDAEEFAVRLGVLQSSSSPLSLPLID
ncbi:hypothetical protein [Streptosporangium sp. NPDC048865]|uniref:hypothetical protein n=1 Tax=Streptosporangium sp. NPDC048865 TaxID=3155766 RepID=UPI0034489AC4